MTMGQIGANSPEMASAERWKPRHAEQDKHSLRARIGTPGGRVEIRTASGGIHVQPSSDRFLV